jgi:WhiB family redox-sensing transcriptional regulator
MGNFNKTERNRKFSPPGGRVAAVEIIITRQQTDDAWMDAGACRGMTHLFFPTTAERPQARERREALARSVCTGCNVQDVCRDFARDNHEYGLWGGESEDERHEAGFRLIAPIGIRANAS